MLRFSSTFFLATLLAASSVVATVGPNQVAAAPQAARTPPSHQAVVNSVAQMVGKSGTRRMASKHGLQLLNVMWEDTGRYLGSSVGPNISDVTIEVEYENASSKMERRLMPVIRYPNFTDKTGDIDIDKFFVRVGNQEEGKDAETISLRKLLDRPLDYMSMPKMGTIKGGTLLAKRDEHVLVSAQSAFLPIRTGGSTRFWPVIFNYQSYAKNPAVLTILVTRQGTSMTIVDNSRDTVGGGGSWGQRLYFNHEGERAPLTAERLTDVEQSGVTMNGEAASSLGDDANLLMMIQVPLKVAQSRRSGIGFVGGGGFGEGAGMAPPTSAADKSGAVLDSLDAEALEDADMDTAVLGHGPTEGPFTELDGLTIERDSRFPVRVTVQFYQATSTGVITQKHVDMMAAQIDKVYKQSDYVGSLVVPEGEPRPTMWNGAHRAPAYLNWSDFAGLRERYGKYGWAGVMYRSDMMSGGVYNSPPSAPATIIASGAEVAIDAVFGGF